MGNENNEHIKEMLLAIEANIEFLKEEGNAQLIIRNGKFVNDIGDSYIYEFVLDFFQDIDLDTEIEIRTRNNSAGGKVISQDERRIQISLDKNIGPLVSEAKLIISSYYLLKLLHEKISGIESGETKLTNLAEKTFGLREVEISIDDEYKIPYALEDSSKLNQYQEGALRLSLGSEVSFIWGPPGTGKTQTIARIIEGFTNKGMSVLLLSHTNKATDGALKGLAKLLKKTEDYNNGKFVRVGKKDSIDEDLRRKYPLVIQENILEEMGLPIRKELDLLDFKKGKIINDLGSDEEILRDFDELKNISNEIEELENVDNEIKKQIGLLETNLDVLSGALNEINKKIERHQNEGFFVKLFLGSLENIIKEKTSTLIGIEKTKNLLKNQKDSRRIVNSKLKNFLVDKEEIHNRSKNKNIIEVRQRYDIGIKMLEDIEKQAGLLMKQIDELENNLIGGAKVVATTLTKSYSDKLVLNREYDCVIIDESSMAPLPALWCASGLAKRRVVIVGDFYQLPPVVKHRVLRDKKTEKEIAMEENLVRKWLSRDIFEVVGITEAIKNGNGSKIKWLKQLRVQYRMHPEIADIINTLIYSKSGNEFSLESDKTTFELGKNKLNKEPLKNLHVGIYNTSSIGSVAGRTDSGSYYNFYHAFLVAELARRASESGYKEIGIITPFRPQANLIQKILKDLGLDKDDLVTADTVHRFQGGEKEVVIFDLTTPNPTKLTDDKGSGGDDEKILNVAFSRAQEKCIVVADVEKVIKKHSASSLFREFFDYCFEKNIKVFSSEDVLDKYSLTTKTEKWLEKVYDAEKLTKEIHNSKLFSESDFYSRFVKDLFNADKEVIIDSPYIGAGRMKFIMPVFQHLRSKAINVFVITRQPSEHNDAMKYEATKVIEELEKIGVVVLTFKGQIHRKLAVIDRKIVWEGSLNILSQNDSKEVMRRFIGEETAKQMLGFLKLDKNIGKIGENNLCRCEYCQKPGAWYWTDKGMYGVWTFCLVGMHKKGAPPKTEAEIKEKKRTLTKVRKAAKKKTESGVPICQIHDVPMVKRNGRFGEFWGCPKYPKCRNVEKI